MMQPALFRSALIGLGLFTTLPVFAQTTNIEIVLDASGSMYGEVEGEAKIDAARRAIRQMIEALPADNERLNVGFRVYGHRGDNTEAMKDLSCSSTELLVPIAGVDKSALRDAVTDVTPTGWTPISLALAEAAEDFPVEGDQRNVIVLVTDGKETCDRNPCTLADSLVADDSDLRIDVVGFNLTSETADTLRCIPANANGEYFDAADGDALVATLNDIVEREVERVILVIDEEPVADGTLAIRATGLEDEALDENHPWNQVLRITTITDQDGEPVDLSVMQGDLIRTGSESMSLPAGLYTVYVEQQLGGRSLLTFTTPEANNVQQITVKIGEGSTTELVLQPASLRFIDKLNDPAMACYLALEVESEEGWVAAHPAPPADLCHAVEGELYTIENGIWPGEEYPLLPGNYRLINTADDTMVADTIELDSGESIELQLTSRLETTQR